MTYPFMDDPVPPGHGESLRVEEPDRVYNVVVVLGDGVPQVEEKFLSLDKAVEHREKVRGELKAQGYGFYFVGVMDADDPEAGWLGDDLLPGEREAREALHTHIANGGHVAFADESEGA